MSFGKGIPLASGFDYGAKSPLDSRICVNTIAERDEHVTSNRAYEGMLVYVTEEKKLYRYEENVWKVIPTSEDIPEKISELDNDRQFVTKDEVDGILTESDYITKEEVDDILKNVDLEGDDCWHLGEVVPEDNDLIWFSGSTSTQSNYTYDNPVIQEIFASLKSLQRAVSKLQEDVEYIKIHGGGQGSGGGTVTDNSSLALEDGSLFLLEDGSLLLLEEAIQQIADTILLLEDGAEFLLEDGGSIKLEEQNEQEVIREPFLLMENSSELLLENNGNINLE
jgi:hypothetical protein